MTTAAELRALAEEVEVLSGPNFDVERRIARAVGRPNVPPSPPYYTASIDAAASLMPEGWEVEVYDDRHFRQRWCVVTNPPSGVHVPKPDVWTARPGATEPLARTAAALRARAALLDEAAA